MNHREQWLAKREEEPAHSQSQSRFVDDIIKQQKRAVEIASQAVEALERSAWTRTRTRRIGFAALTVVAAIALCILRFLSDVVNWGLERIIATSIAEISVTTALLASTIWVRHDPGERLDGRSFPADRRRVLVARAPPLPPHSSLPNQLLLPRAAHACALRRRARRCRSSAVTAWTWP